MAKCRERSHASDRVKLLLDMNLSPTWVMVLEEAGFEVLHCPRSVNRQLLTTRFLIGRRATDTSSSLTIWTLGPFSRIPSLTVVQCCKFGQTTFRPMPCKQFLLLQFEARKPTWEKAPLSRLASLGLVFDFCLLSDGFGKVVRA
jgi:hypothetical protein